MHVSLGKESIPTLDNGTKTGLPKTNVEHHAIVEEPQLDYKVGSKSSKKQIQELI